MKRLFVFLLLAVAVPAALAQNIPPPGEMSNSSPPPPPASTDSSPASAPASAASPHSERGTQKAIDHLTRANQELLDLLKQQQTVLEDIQYDRRLQNRQITLLEQRLEDTLQANAALQARQATLEAQLAAAKAAPTPAESSSPPPATHASEAANTAPPAPVSFLPPEQTDGAPGTQWWHRLLKLSGDDSKDSETFHIAGKPWRVVWHNQDRPGDAYKNTSALFINAFPASGALPKKVCSQLGTGGDTTTLTGTGDFSLKVEASGGTWELAVEEFR